MDKERREHSPKPEHLTCNLRFQHLYLGPFPSIHLIEKMEGKKKKNWQLATPSVSLSCEA